MATCICALMTFCVLLHVTRVLLTERLSFNLQQRKQQQQRSWRKSVESSTDGGSGGSSSVGPDGQPLPPVERAAKLLVQLEEQLEPNNPDSKAAAAISTGALAAGQLLIRNKLQDIALASSCHISRGRLQVPLCGYLDAGSVLRKSADAAPGGAAIHSVAAAAALKAVAAGSKARWLSRIVDSNQKSLSDRAEDADEECRMNVAALQHDLELCLAKMN
jgi:hypothetical protein